MLGNCRRLAVAVLACLLFQGPAFGQEVPDVQGGRTEEIIGPRELREFQLPGTTSQPAPEEPAPPAEAETAPPAADSPATDAAPPRLEIPAPIFTEEQVEGESAEASRSNADAEATSGAPASESTSSATGTQDIGEGAGASTATERAAAAKDAPRPTVVPESIIPSTGISWPYILAALLLAFLGFLGGRFLQKRSAAGDEAAVFAKAEVVHASDQQPPMQRTAEAAPAATPLPRTSVADVPRRPPARNAPASRAQSGEGGTIGIQIRPWLKLQFKPERAAATDTEAAVHYELIVSNTGNAAARNVRIQARMFNAGADQEREIGAFFTAAGNGHNGGRELSIPPRSSARLRNVVAMPKDQVREITIEGRRLFVPMVAFNVFYEWGDGKSGQTSMSYLVGRESEKPSDKMGAFRLDLGPRVYRSVGQRPSDVAVLV